MIRSMYSGVAGLRTHQTRMDTIGNNIANVNTYGYKSGRTTFRDIYYQNLNSASAPNTGTGGVNPSQVGTGTKVGSIDLMMDGSSLTMTSQGMDVAIDGEGFLQVMDGNGNIYYTRAGMLGFDAAGNLVDMQGNYVLGINGDPVGRAATSERITVNLPAVSPAAARTDLTLNSKTYSISASNPTKDGNLSFAFTSDPTMNDNIKASAKMTSAGVQITLNENIAFSNWDEVNQAINAAITAANGGKAHPAGDFKIEFTGDPSLDPFRDKDGNAQTLSGKDLASIDYTVSLGSASFTATDASTILGGVQPSGVVGSTFGEGWLGGLTTADMGAMAVSYAGGPPEVFTFTTVIDGITYTGTVDSSKTSTTGKFNMTAQGGDANDYFEMKRPDFATLKTNLETLNGGPVTTYTVAAADLGNGTAAPTVTASVASKAVGLSGSAIALKNGTQGGLQTLSDMAGISILQDGTVVGLDSTNTEIIIGQIILATFANSSGLEMTGSSLFNKTANSGDANLVVPGLNNSGKLVSGALELSNVDLSQEFSDMITTQRGYQANSRIITVSDTMLEELINLKR